MAGVGGRPLGQMLEAIAGRLADPEAKERPTAMQVDFTNCAIRIPTGDSLDRLYELLVKRFGDDYPTRFVSGLKLCSVNAERTAILSFTMF
jgi:seryl-tRNA(Sec) selenium transferase